MRQVGLSDLDQAARVLLAVPREAWSETATRLIEDAHVADVWRKRHAKAHPDGGTGSLYAQAALHVRARSGPSSEPYCAALAVILQALKTWRKRVSQCPDHEK